MIYQRVVPFIVVIPFLLTSLTSQGAETQWKVYAKNDNEPVVEYYDMASVTYPAKGIVRLKLKTACADKKKCSEFRKNLVRQSPGQVNSGYEKWAYNLKTVDLRCSDNKVRFLTTTNVDEDGKIIDSTSWEKFDTWEELKNPWNLPDPMEELFKIVCK